MTQYRCLICGEESEEFGPYHVEDLLCRRCVLDRKNKWWEGPRAVVVLMLIAWMLIGAIAWELIQLWSTTW